MAWVGTKMDTRFRHVSHTLVVSDLHLTEAEEPDPLRPQWMRYKHRDLHIDPRFARFLEFQRQRLPGETELVLNGDTFDFDAVMAIPAGPPFPVSWLERLRGLWPEEEKSRHKMRVILDDHPVFVQALRDWILAGNRLVLVVGNHDMELLWGAVQQEFQRALNLPVELRDRVRICEWFYISNGDTLVEHGSQYDAYCLCSTPLQPRIRRRGRLWLRLSFGNLAGRLMLNGMGLMNPYVESTFIKSLHEYVLFFFRHVIRIQPLLLWSWLWSAVATLLISLQCGFSPAVRDPLTLEARQQAAARRSNTSAGTLRALDALRVHPAIFNPWKIMRELWLDRALILALLFVTSIQLIGFLNIFGSFSPAWAFLAFLLLLPPFVFYARSVRPDLRNTLRTLRKVIPTALRITGTHRAVIGHTHEVGYQSWEGAEMLCTGTWSPAFEDVAYTRPFSQNCFAWIHPAPQGGERRVAELLEWKDPGCALVETGQDEQSLDGA